MDDFDLLFAIEESEEEGINDKNIKNKCRYANIMKSLGIDVHSCNHEPKKNAILCYDHKICEICQNPTINKSKLCVICKCSYDNCGEKRVVDSTCGQHKCISCGKEKLTYQKQCKNCKCIITKCSETKMKNGYVCENHACDHCDTYMKNPLNNHNNWIKGQPCPNNICKCISGYCNDPLINKFTCLTHLCPYCEHLYDSANCLPEKGDYYRKYIYHIIVKGMSHETNRKAGIDCPNQKVIECTAGSQGYNKSKNCIKLILDDDDYPWNKYAKEKLCVECYNENKCTMCYNNVIKSFELKVCNNCTFEFACLNCNKKYSRKKSVGLPELCPLCMSKVNACVDCKKVFPLDSIEFPPDNIYPNKFFCATCISLTGVCDSEPSCMKRASLISLKVNDEFNQYINRIHCRKDNKVSIDLIYNLVIHLLWQVKTVETYYKTLRLLTRSSLASDKEIVNYLPNNDTDNVLGLFIRCSDLPSELFWYILKMI